MRRGRWYWISIPVFLLAVGVADYVFPATPLRGIYLSSDYAHTTFTPASASQLLTTLCHPDFVSSEAFDITGTNYTTIDNWMVGNMVSAFHAAQPGIKLFVVACIPPAPCDPSDMANATLRANFVNTVANYVNANGWDGVYLDIEPIADPSYDSAQTWFLPLLQALKTAIPGKTLVVFGEKLQNPPWSEWNWTPTYLKSVAAIADYVEIGCYDTEITTDTAYQTWILGQIGMVNSQSLGNIIYTMPAYPVAGYPSHTSVENIGNCGALKDYSTDIFKQPTMSSNDYTMYYELLGISLPTATMTATPVLTPVTTTQTPTPTPVLTPGADHSTPTQTTTRIPAMAADGTIVIFPNPVRDYVRLYWSGPAAQRVTVKVFNSAGERVSVIRREHPGPTIDWQTSAMAPGIYLLKINVILESGEERRSEAKLAVAR